MLPGLLSGGTSGFAFRLDTHPGGVSTTPVDRPPTTDEPWDDAFSEGQARPLPTVPEPPPVPPPVDHFAAMARCVVGPCRFFHEVAGPGAAGPQRTCLKASAPLWNGVGQESAAVIPLRCTSWDPMEQSDFDAREQRRLSALDEHEKDNEA